MPWPRKCHRNKLGHTETCLVLPWVFCMNTHPSLCTISAVLVITGVWMHFCELFTVQNLLNPSVLCTGGKTSLHCPPEAFQNKLENRRAEQNIWTQCLHLKAKHFLWSLFILLINIHWHALQKYFIFLLQKSKSTDSCTHLTAQMNFGDSVSGEFLGAAFTPVAISSLLWTRLDQFDSESESKGWKRPPGSSSPT